MSTENIECPCEYIGTDTCADCRDIQQIEKLRREIFEITRMINDQHKKVAEYLKDLDRKNKLLLRAKEAIEDMLEWNADNTEEGRFPSAMSAFAKSVYASIEMEEIR